MQFENQFEVDAPMEEVWKTILDVERVAPNVPGAKVLERTGDNAYKVSIKVKVGPMSMTYKGDVEIVEQDDAAHRAVMRAKAKESRGQGTANADVTMVLSGENGRTAGQITTDVDVTGKVASMGRGMLQDVSGRLIAAFADNLEKMLAGGEAPTAEEPAAATAGQPAGEPASRQAPPPPPPPRDTGGDDALDLGSVGGAMVADKLQDPRNLGLVIGLAMLVAYLLGRRSAK